MMGFWWNEEATRAAFAGGWSHSGDVTRSDAAGNRYIVDRIKDMFIIGGDNVYSREMKGVLYQHEVMAEAAVVGVPDLERGEKVVACVRRRAGTTVDEPEPIEHCRNNLAGYKKPKRVVFMDELARNAAGRILKRTRRQMLLQESDVHSPRASVASVGLLRVRRRSSPLFGDVLRGRRRGEAHGDVAA